MRKADLGVADQGHGAAAGGDDQLDADLGLVALGARLGDGQGGIRQGAGEDEGQGRTADAQ